MNAEDVDEEIIKFFNNLHPERKVVEVSIIYDLKLTLKARKDKEEKVDAY
jgi:hypothetical protein